MWSHISPTTNSLSYRMMLTQAQYGCSPPVALRSVVVEIVHRRLMGGAGVPGVVSDPVLHIPEEIGPGDCEAAVLSGILVHDGSRWVTVSGSLLTVPKEVAAMSQREWREVQPHASARMDHVGGIEPGATFCEEPFDGVRAIREILDSAEWQVFIEGLQEGKVGAKGCLSSLSIRASTPTVMLGQDGRGEAYDAVEGACRPVRGVVATLGLPEMPQTGDTWELGMPEGLEPGPERGRLWRERHLLHWPNELLGIDWLGSSEFLPPARFVIGRTISEAWIARIKPEFEEDQIVISIAWDENVVDPLGCSLVLRTESSGLPLLERRVALTELPGGAEGASEPRNLGWRERTLDVRLTRGSRRTDWGLKLMKGSGDLLDERPVATRVEEIKMALHVNGGEKPSSVVHMGDKRPVPTNPETDAAIKVAGVIEESARQAAGKRRLSTAGELESYLRWRFSCRQGELLLLDPFLLNDKPEDVIGFLRALNRPIRALARSIPPGVSALLAGAPQLAVRVLPNGRSTLHDRIWIVGETGVLVGTSVGTFLADPAGAPRRATTATDLPYADAALWREKFEKWWTAK